MPTPIFLGSEWTPSTAQSLTNATLRAITPLANGTFISGIASSEGLVFHHRADGGLKGQTALHATGGPAKSNWTFSALNDGGFVVSWDEDVSGTPWQAWVQAGVYNADGTARASSFRVNDVLTNTDNNGAITALADGGFAVAYTNTQIDGSFNGVLVRTFTQNGTPVGNGVQINTKSTNDQEAPSIAALKNGGFVVVYEDDSMSPDHSGGTTVRGRFFVSGEPSVELHIPTTPGGDQFDPQVAVLADGRFVVTWTNSDLANPEDGSNTSVCARIYNADGTPATSQFRVNTTTEWAQHQSSVTALRNGGFAVAFTNDRLGTDDNGDILVQLFTASGAKDGAELRVNTTTRADQTNPIISELADGRIVVGWNDQAVSGGQNNVRLQVLDARTAGITQTGTAGADDFVGTAFGDVFDGGLGNDTIDGGAGADTVIFSGARADYTVTKEASGALRVTNKTGEADIVSNFESFTFAGVTFSLAELLASVVTPPPTTTPVPATLYSATSLTLPAVALNLIATGKANITLVGNAVANTIKGNAGKNVLKGLSGNDKLWGGLGNDTLYGGTGKDVFVFSTKPNKKTNLDKIADFNVKDDTVWLDNKVFTKLGKGTELKPGKLNKAFFTIGDKAKDTNDYLIYDNKKGALYYDVDGSGSKAAVEIAILKKGLKMSAADFMVM